jgi:hypothetical protein
MYRWYSITEPTIRERVVRPSLLRMDHTERDSRRFEQDKRHEGQVPAGIRGRLQKLVAATRGGRDDGEHGPGERLQLFRARVGEAPGGEHQDPRRHEEDELGGVCESKRTLDLVYRGSSFARPFVVCVVQYFP